MLLVVRRRRRTPNMRAGQGHGDRMPVVANVTAFAWFFSILLTLPGTLVGYGALLLALTGCILSVAGAAVVLRSRMELGPAWSLVPIAHEATGLVTTGPYRLVPSNPSRWRCGPGSRPLSPIKCVTCSLSATILSRSARQARASTVRSQNKFSS